MYTQQLSQQQTITSLVSLGAVVTGEVISIDHSGKGRIWLELETGQRALLPIARCDLHVLRCGVQVTATVCHIGQDRQFRPFIVVTQKPIPNQSPAVRYCLTAVQIKSTVVGRNAAGLLLQTESGEELTIRHSELHRLPKECLSKGAELVVRQTISGPSGTFATAIGAGLGLA